MTMAKRCLFICYGYPPSSTPGAVRVSRIVKRLPLQGWQPLVMTAGEQGLMRSSGLADPLAGEPGSVIRVADPLAGAVKAAGGSVNVVGQSPTLAVRLARTVLFPDRSAPWAMRLRLARDAVRKAAPDVVVSTAPTLSTHLAARGLARAAGVPWIAEFRDPVSWLPEQDETGPWRRRALAAIERWVVENADATVTISEAFSEYFRSLYPAARIHTVPNGIDFRPEAIEAALAARAARLAAKRPGDPLVLVHAGALYNGAREPGPLIAAAKRAAEGSARPIRLRFIGPDSHLAGKAAAELGASDLVEVVGAMDHAATVRETEQADVVVALLHRDPVARIGIMSKFFDYAATGNPVLVVGEREAMLSRIVEDEGAGAAFAYDDTAGLAAWIGRTAADPAGFSCDTLALAGNWSADSMARQMAAVLDQVVARQRG